MALTVALAVGMRRMVKRRVIIRRLVGVEGLGSCTFIATDKTGTLTVNQLTAKQLLLPNGDQLQITGEGMSPQGEILDLSGARPTHLDDMLESLCQAAVLANEGFLGRRDGAWVHHGDAVDVALLVLAQMYGARAGGILTTDGNLVRDKNPNMSDYDPHREVVAEGKEQMLVIALEALAALA